MAEQEDAFRVSKPLLTSSQVLVHFDPNLDIVLSCGASAYGIGTVLSHRMPDGSEKPIGSVSRTLSSAELIEGNAYCSHCPDSVHDEELKPFSTRRSKLSAQDGCVLWGNRVVVPEAGRAKVLRELHEVHPGAIRMKRLAWMFVWWPGLDKDIADKVKSCPECQSCRPAPPSAPLLPWQWPSCLWA